MTRRALTLAFMGALILTAQPRAALQNVLVLCTADQCEYRVVTSVLVGGRSSVRVVSSAADVINPSALGKLPEIKLDQMVGMYRDPRTGVFQTLDLKGERRDLVIPAKLLGKQALPPAATWQGVTIEYSSANVKAKTAVAPDHFAYLLVSADAEQSVFTLLQHLLNPAETDPRRSLLIRGALQFPANSQTAQKWREALLVKTGDAIKRFDDQVGDPTALADALHESVRLRAIYLQVDADPPNRQMLDHIVSTDDLFKQRLATIDALRTAGLWDDYLVKLRQLGVAKWSVPETLSHSREALAQSAKLHLDRSRDFVRVGHLDRAFDEAELAARSSCEPSVLDNFYRARVMFVDRNQIAASLDYSGGARAFLEQIVRELEQLDPNKEQLTLERIRQGEALDPNFLPLQFKKAEFLDKVGKYAEALAVVRRIERTVRLDRKQLDVSLGLDGRITNNLLDALQKAQDATLKEFEDRRYQEALVAAGKGLKADPANAPLLYYSALSAAFLRQNAAALTFIRAYLTDANVTCTPEGEPEKVLELYRLVAAPAPPRDPPEGIPHWISGARYRLNEVFYDPVSLGFLQPVTRISGDGGLTTLFRREDRSFLVNFISTERVAAGSTNGSATTSIRLFEAEPKYDRQTLSMLEIGSRPSPAGVRTVHSLTYSNSPLVDPDLVLRFTGKQIARGWAGNPFFHPFIWSGFYVFDFTYDGLGRVVTATPTPEEAGSRADPFSEPLRFAWYGDTKRLLTVRGTRTGYLRELHYDNAGLLISETISHPRGHGQIEYEYLPRSAQLKGAKCRDNFYDNRERVVSFDWNAGVR